jgi:hypothetical protein
LISVKALKWHEFYSETFMHEKNYTGLVPENTEGKKITAEAVATFHDEDEARQFYKVASERLLNVNDWGKRAGSLSAEFQLTDEHGNQVKRAAHKGDHFRIDIPGPGSKAGGGYDWVVVEDIKEVKEKNVESIAVLVRPTSNPKTNDENVAHFYSEASTSTFEIAREDKKVTATIYDRNVQANTETEETIDKIRNTVVGVSARHGGSKIQWQALADALVKKD